jgi:hypothetical protein
MRRFVVAVALALIAPALHAGGAHGAHLEVIVEGMHAQELRHGGTTYVEAVRGREYSLRLVNPTPYRVAVALSVDGLNSINAKHSDPWTAAKWVLDPYESTEIHGWQVNDATARRFVFTGERNSYGAALGQTENLGVIEAVFYRELQRPVAQEREYSRKHSTRPEASSSADASAGAVAAPSAPALDDDYAATGMGDRTRHEVRNVHIRLDREPIAHERIRYEFRPALAKLGVLPRGERPLDRRERARGFEYCPEP